MITMDFKILEEKFKKAEQGLIEDLNKVHAGRVTPTLLKPVTAQYIDGRTGSVMEAGLVRVVNAKTLAIKPWNDADIPAIEKAIRNSKLGVNPGTKDGEIHINFPDMTQERREEFAKTIKQYSEDAKHKIRTTRHDFIKENKQGTKEEEVKFDRQVQKLVDQYNKNIDAHVKKKQDELMKL